jgi:hypothetical protein
MLIKNGSTPTIVFFLVDATDGETPETGLSPTVYISKNGGTAATTTNSAAEIDATNMQGWYKVALTATETNTDGSLIVWADSGGTTKSWYDVHQVYTNFLHDDEMDDIADHILMRNTATTESSGSGDTIQQYALINAIRAIVGRVEISGSSLNVYEEDESTTAFTRTVATDASADPVTGLS